MALMTAVDKPWNINIHYDVLLDSQVPPGVRAFSTFGALRIRSHRRGGGLREEFDGLITG